MTSARGPDSGRFLRACSSFMSVEADTKSSRLLIFFSLAFRVTAALVYDSISLAGARTKTELTANLPTGACAAVHRAGREHMAHTCRL